MAPLPEPASPTRAAILTRKVQHIESDARTKYIKDLIEAEQIVLFQRSTGGRAATWFRLAEHSPQ